MADWGDERNQMRNQNRLFCRANWAKLPSKMGDFGFQFGRNCNAKCCSPVGVSCYILIRYHTDISLHPIDFGYSWFLFWKKYEGSNSLFGNNRAFSYLFHPHFLSLVYEQSVLWLCHSLSLQVVPSIISGLVINDVDTGRDICCIDICQLYCWGFSATELVIMNI